LDVFIGLHGVSPIFYSPLDNTVRTLNIPSLRNPPHKSFLPEVREFITRHTAYNKHDRGGRDKIRYMGAVGGWGWSA
jgi:hypothetical protein